MHVGDSFGVFWVGDGVGVFVGVVDEVVVFVAFAFALADVVDQLFGLGAQADHGWEMGKGWVFEIFEEEIVAGDITFVGQERAQRMTVVMSGHAEACDVHNCCGDVETEDVIFNDTAWIGDQVGIAYEVGHTNGGFVHPAFVAQAEFAVEVAVVAGVNDQCVIGLSDFIDFVERSSKGIVYASHGAHVVAHKGVVAFIVLEAVGAFTKCAGFAIAGCGKGVGFGKFVVGIGVGISRWGGEGAVWGFVPEADGPGAVVVFVEELFEVVGEQIGIITFVFDFFAVNDEDGVFVVALPAKAHPAVKTGFGITTGFVDAFGSEVYFAKKGCAIARFLQLLGPGSEVGIYWRAIVCGTVGVWIDTREMACSAWRAKRNGGEAVGKTDPFTG